MGNHVVLFIFDNEEEIEKILEGNRGASINTW